MSERKQGELLRLRSALSQHRALVDSLESSALADLPIGASANAVADSAIRIATTAARFDAFSLAALTPPTTKPEKE